MTVGAQPAAPAAAAPAAAPTHHGRTALFVVLGVVLIFAVTYAFAWLQAGRLSARYLDDADQSYEQGEYLRALVGYEEFDPETNSFVTHGGYLQVERIWTGRYAWPLPAGVGRAPERSAEIINQRLTIPQAERFVQENIGRPNPYFGVIYLRLGELYEEDGDEASAEEVYETVIQSFRDQPDLIRRAEEHLANLAGG